MTVQTYMHRDFCLSRCFGAPHCPQCNDMLLAPEKSEFVREGRIRHAWSCESCGHAFTTSVKYGVK